MLFFALCLPSFAQQTEEVPSDFLITLPFKQPSLSEFENTSINKTLLRIASEQKEYQLTFTDDLEFKGTKVSVYSLEISVVKTEGLSNVFDIKAVLGDIKKGKVLKVKRKENVKRKTIQKEVERLLYSIFGEDEILDKKNKKKKKKASIKSKPVDKKYDNGLKDFKQRILKLKIILQDKFEEIKQKIIKKKIDEEKEQALKESQQKKSKSQTKPIQANNKVLAKEKKRKKYPSINVENFTFIGVGYWSNDVESEYIVNTNTYLPQLMFTAQRGYFFTEEEVFYYSLSAKIGNLMSDYEIDVEGSTEYKIALGAKNDEYRTQVEAHLSYHEMSYGNLSSTGEGVVAAKHVNYWLDFNVGIRRVIYNRPFKLNLQYGTLISGNMSFPNIDSQSLTGSRYGAEFIAVNVWKRMSIAGGISYMNMQSKAIDPVVVESNVFDTFYASSFSVNTSLYYTF